MPQGPQRSPRHRVHFSVTYASAERFVKDYAFDLSAGGIFLSGAHGRKLAADDLVELELQLPGLGIHRVTARVVHVIDWTSARKLGREPGAGLEFVTPPAAFTEALYRYFLRLGRRRESMVFVDDPDCGEMLRTAGYIVAPLPGAERLAQAMVQSPTRVIGVVCGPGEEAAYRAAALEAGAGELVHALGESVSRHNLLYLLDEEL